MEQELKQELKQDLANMLNDFKKSLPVGVSAEDLTAKMAEFETKLAEKFTPKDYSGELEALKTAMLEIESKVARKSSEKRKSVAEAILDTLKEKGVNNYADLKKLKDQEIELKADNQIATSVYTGNVSRTQEVAPVMFPRLRPTAFLGQPGIRTGVVESGKSILLWTVGAYTSNAGYVGEFTAIADGNAATGTEKTRKMAKLGARQIITQETMEDLPQFAQRVQAKLMETIQLKFDELVLAGLGNDSTKPTEVYGLKTAQMTAFDSTKVFPVENPNVADLVDACATQAELNQYKTNTVWMNPKLANKLRRTKDNTGQYIVNQLITGELVMGGHRVITNTGIGANEMIVGDAAAIQIWFKRNFTMKLEDKPDLDAMAMYIYLRAQVLVEDDDIKGLIYVADVDTALQAIATV